MAQRARYFPCSPSPEMLITICAFLFLASSSSLQNPVPDPIAPEQPFDPVAVSLAAAQEARAAGALGEAYDRLTEALALAPEEPSVRLWLARVLNDLGRFEESLEMMAPALKALPNSAWLLVERGRAERGLLHLERAQGDFRAALSVYPSLDSARLELVGSLVQAGAGRAADALEELQPLLERHPTRTAIVLRHAEVLALLDRDSESEAVLRAKVDEPRVALALCQWLARRDRFAEAWAVGAGLTDHVTDPMGLTLLAQVARRAGDPVASLQLLARALSADDSPPGALVELDALLDDADRLRTALAERRLKENGTDASAWIGFCEELLSARRFEELLQRCSGLPEEVRDEPRLAILCGQALRRLGRDSEARARLTPLAAQGNARASYELGLIDYAAERFTEAAGYFEKGASGDWAADAHYNRGICLDRLQDYRGAADSYRAATAARPGFAEAWLQLGHDLRLRLGQADGARKAYQRFLDLGGDDPEVRRFVGAGS